MWKRKRWQPKPLRNNCSSIWASRLSLSLSLSGSLSKEKGGRRDGDGLGTELVRIFLSFAGKKPSFFPFPKAHSKGDSCLLRERHVIFLSGFLFFSLSFFSKLWQAFFLFPSQFPFFILLTLFVSVLLSLYKRATRPSTETNRKSSYSVFLLNCDKFLAYFESGFFCMVYSRYVLYIVLYCTVLYCRRKNTNFNSNCEALHTMYKKYPLAVWSTFLLLDKFFYGSTM